MTLLQDTKTKFMSKVRLQQEPDEFLAQSLEIFNHVNKVGAQKAFEGKEKEATFFVETFTPQVARTLVQNIKAKLSNKKFEEMVTQMPRVLAQVLYNHCDNLELWSGMKSLFDPKARLYTLHMLSEENAVLLETCKASFSEEERKWRDSFQVGQEIDAVKVEPLLECRCWARATITKKIDSAVAGEPSKVLVSFPDDSNVYERTISINSRDLARIEDAKSKEDDEFR